MLTLPVDHAFIIAEAGTNHAGDKRVMRAMDHIDAAASARADAVKFQMFCKPESSEDFFCPLPGDGKRWRRWERSSISREGWYDVKQYAEGKGLVFLASTFQHSTVAWLNELGVVATKVASRAAKSFPYKDAPAPYLISLGMVDAKDSAWFIQDSILLECESKYPSTKRWQWPQQFDAGFGFSDHSGTPWRAIDAISRGCRLIEVHFHLDERDAGPDLSASLTLDELKLVCEARDAFADLRKS